MKRTKNVKIIKEELAKGMPEFAMDAIASSCAEQTKGHLVKYVQGKSKDAVAQREMLDKANRVLDALEEEMKEVIKKRVIEFLYNL
jgi:DUF438 domain-containing protein